MDGAHVLSNIVPVPLQCTPRCVHSSELPSPSRRNFLGPCAVPPFGLCRKLTSALVAPAHCPQVVGPAGVTARPSFGALDGQLEGSSAFSLSLCVCVCACVCVCVSVQENRGGVFLHAEISFGWRHSAGSHFLTTPATPLGLHTEAPAAFLSPSLRALWLGAMMMKKKLEPGWASSPLPLLGPTPCLTPHVNFGAIGRRLDQGGHVPSAACV